ncbi:MAG: DUF1801 domain-containing protein [Candidatus Dojkabacteria bacterium]|nr:MAG: DUF1801 domain-containing protein [Candidatus Dojkabacteria bacterium]
MNIQEQIDSYIQSLPSWQQDNLKLFRKVLHNAMPDIVEDWKWAVPVFLIKKKVLFAMSAFKAHTKFNFFVGSIISDQHKLFNGGLDSKKHRSIDLHEGEKVNEQKLIDLVHEAINSVK